MNKKIGGRIRNQLGEIVARRRMRSRKSATVLAGVPASLVGGYLIPRKLSRAKVWGTYVRRDVAGGQRERLTSPAAVSNGFVTRKQAVARASWSFLSYAATA